MAAYYSSNFNLSDVQILQKLPHDTLYSKAILFFMLSRGSVFCHFKRASSLELLSDLIEVSRSSENLFLHC